VRSIVIVVCLDLFIDQVGDVVVCHWPSCHLSELLVRDGMRKPSGEQYMPVDLVEMVEHYALQRNQSTLADAAFARWESKP